MRPSSATPHYSTQVVAQGRRRRLKRILVPVLLGIIVAAYTYGALDARAIAEDRNDLLPQGVEAALLGTVFAVASLPVGWSILGRILIPIPTLFLYLSVFLGKNPPLPFPAAFVLALVYAGALTTLSAYLGDRPDRPRLGSRR
ncbi:MAG: hypothetical protein JO213_03815 [Alphaproteobacteria bacterium]|nr:hypothetical protein [Alphaproteobacteria bacterium]MBV9583995.1 hypothetical protein [Alphaproteobacteria bacterium]MBV9967730.1 hypothetical protein [Alphaproteobacteria bacterium]